MPSLSREPHPPAGKPSPKPLSRAQFWGLALATLVVVSLTVRLGFWQLSRAAEKQAWQTAMATQRDLPVLDMSPSQDQNLASTQEWLKDWGQPHLLHRRVTVRGTWLPQFNVYLDNRQMDGKVGFFLLTPLQLDHSDQAIWVQRGWLPRNFQQREQLPEVLTPSGPVSLSARIALAPSKLMELGSTSPGSGFSHLRQNLDESEMRRETGLNLLSGSLVQLSPEGDSDALLRNWFEPAADTAKHKGYALQWFAMALGAAAWFFWFAFFKVWRKSGNRDC